MLNLERIERLIIAVLVAALVAGLAVAVYRRNNHPSVIISEFNPDNYKSASSKASNARVINKVDINHATAEEIAFLKGIGPAIARRIVEYRTANGYFLSKEDVKKVKGVGDGLFDKIKDDISTD